MTRRLARFIESLPMGKLVECIAGQFIHRDIPDQVLSENRAAASPGAPGGP